MVRAPCCEKMGLKKGPWTPEEDQILVDYVHRYGHANWRALPKQAGLLRCGKSCRLRWVNYLRPDIKRGNFTREEQETIIGLHGMLGNRWSAIAAKLPGRTDNEIKNVWHTHLKKRFVGPNMSSSGSSKRKTTGCSRTDRTVLSQPLPTQLEADHRGARLASMSPEQSYSDLYSFSTDWSGASGGGIGNVKEEGCSSQELQEIDEGFWLETLSTDEPATLTIPTTTPPPTNDQFDLFTSSDMDDTDFWLNVFMGAGDLQELSQL